MAASEDSIAAFWFVFQLVGMDPGQRYGHHAELQMIGDGMGVSSLAVGATGVLLEFCIAGLDFPARPIPRNDLLHGLFELGFKCGAARRRPLLSQGAGDNPGIRLNDH